MPSADEQARPKRAIDGARDSHPDTVFRTVILNDLEIALASELLGVLVGLEIDRSNASKRSAESERVSSGGQGRQGLVTLARNIFIRRAKRSEFFDPIMFGEGAWDMLLALYVSEDSDARHRTVGGLLSFAGVPPTTAHRWLEYLEQESLVSRRSHPTDKRVTYISLTDQARDTLDAYIAQMFAS